MAPTLPTVECSFVIAYLVTHLISKPLRKFSTITLPFLRDLTCATMLANPFNILDIMKFLNTQYLLVEASDCRQCRLFNGESEPEDARCGAC